MKKRLVPLSMSAIAFLASSCAFRPIVSQGSIESEETSQNSVSSVSSLSSSELSSSSSSKNSSSSRSSSSSSSQSLSSSSDSRNLGTITIDSYYSSYIGTEYSKTNNGTFYDENGFKYQYYMTDAPRSGDLTTLCQTCCDQSDFAGVSFSGGFLGNLNPIPGLDSLKVTYKSSSSSRVVFYDEHGREGLVRSLSSSSSSYATVNITNIGDQYPYFKIFGSLNGEMNLKEFSFTYDLDGLKVLSSRTYSPKEDCRIEETIAPYIEEGTKAKAPNSISQNGTKYTVTSWKEYTYYSFSYISSHTSLARSIAYTSPVDIANYYMLFKRFPCNIYGSVLDLGDEYDVREIFGDSSRQCKRYDKTSGYAKAIDWDRYSGSGYYYEVDIALQDSYPYPRGTGRLVAFDGGVTGYGASSTMFFSDDHYQSFQEYLNYGTFGERFNAQDYESGSSSFQRSFVCGTTWEKALTLTKSSK